MIVMWTSALLLLREYLEGDLEDAFFSALSSALGAPLPLMRPRIEAVVPITAAMKELEDDVFEDEQKERATSESDARARTF